jgi:hypothetical protein
VFVPRYTDVSLATGGYVVAAELVFLAGAEFVFGRVEGGDHTAGAERAGSGREQECHGGEHGLRGGTQETAAVPAMAPLARQAG